MDKEISTNCFEISIYSGQPMNKYLALQFVKEAVIKHLYSQGFIEHETDVRVRLIEK